MSSATLEFEAALIHTDFIEARSPLEGTTPDLMGALREAEERSRQFRARSVSDALIAWGSQHFDEEDVVEFLLDLAEPLRENDIEEFKTRLRLWQRTAEELDDPERRSVLLGTHTDGDFEDVTRPA